MLSMNRRMVKSLGYVMWLRKTRANYEKMCNRLFSFKWDSCLKIWWPGVTRITWVGREYLSRKGMTLWSLKTYGCIGSKTKSYQIQKGFLLLFIFLSSRPWPSGCMLSDPIFPAICLQNFYILSGMHSFTQASDLRSVLQSEPPFAESFADPKGQLLLQQLGWPNTREPYLLRPTSLASYHPYGGLKSRFVLIEDASSQSRKLLTKAGVGYRMI